ncbi:MAG: hypothetical protein DI537_23730 [Stutzerimonas stutzeri]|nr:MAG: hypothetical protein DI537_23730 [Stutzerimonas stutzeri]
MRILHTAAALALLSTGASAQTVVDGSGKEIAPDLLKKVISTVADQTREPESARLRRITAGTSQELRAICGEINSKNAIGAYVGYVGFIFFLKTQEANVYERAFDDRTARNEQNTDLKEAGCPVW